MAPGEFVCLVGASGCGKSTLLNIVAGLDRATSGTVDVGGRKVALMFQEAALFPWLTARGNIELALKLRGVEGPQGAPSSRRELLELVHLADPADAARTSCRAACASGSRWPGPSRRTPRSC